MRHGPAVDPAGAGTDFERPLTGKGREQTAAAARGLQRLGVAPDHLLASPLVRARQTADLVADELGIAVEVEDALAAGAQPGQILAALRKVEGSALLVGHEPDLGRLVSYLLSPDGRPFVDFAKAGVVALESHGGAEAGSCTLSWYLRRKHLALIGR